MALSPTDINNVKNLGMMQNNFQWLVQIPVIPFIGVNNLEFHARSSTIPTKDQKYTTLRWLNQQFTLPAGKEITSPEFEVKILMTETHELFDILLKWILLVPEISVGTAVNSIKTNINVKLLALNTNVVNKRIQLIGCYPITYPELGELNQENTEGQIEISYKFAIDDVNFDPNNELTF
jgi:hypothetical protein